MNPRIYLAGPEVFFPDPDSEADRLKKICESLGMIGCFPTDSDKPKDGSMSLAEKIYIGNVELIDSCDAVIANMTPFRGVSMDVGTAFEIGYAVAQKKPVFGWSAAHDTTYLNRTTEGQVNDGMSVEDFEITDNLMVVIPLQDRTVHATFESAAKSMSKELTQS